MDWQQPLGQDWAQVAALALAFVLSSLIGLEREVRQKHAGLRTHALVGTASALLVLVSKYGFTDVLAADHVSLDPSRVAAQIVSGIGFIGGGVIFVRRDVVSGLTTAAAVWTTSAVGMAAGAQLPLLAILLTAFYFVAVLAFPPLVHRMRRSGVGTNRVTMTYADGRGVLRRALTECTNRGFAVEDLDSAAAGEGTVSVVLEVRGPRPLSELAGALAEIDGVHSVSTGRDED